MSDAAQSWLRAEAIFHDALACVEPERTAILHARCGGDETLMAELRALLAACEAEEAHRSLSAEEAHLAELTEAGRHIGAYAVQRLLGRGGMGAVYLAQRDDGQFRQQVAIKIIDMPLATESFRDRFRTERQILAELSHPYIARLLDGGVSESGELYLAMEYVDGLSMNVFCEQQALTIADRLRLFLKVLEAVQYAHGALVMHRDLKPDNILVSQDGAPHLLDFGTAKIMSPVPEVGDLTQAGMQAFTPRYASPEQVLGRPSALPRIFTRSGCCCMACLPGGSPTC